MEKRDQLLKEILIRFLQHGIRQVKISDVTTSLNVSSKTLYQVFGDKEGLIRAAFELYQANTTADFERWKTQSDNVAALMVNFYRAALAGLSRVNPAFFHELSQSYPHIWNSDSAFGLDHSRALLAQGVEEGIFVPQLDLTICSHTLTYLLRSMLDREPFASATPEQQFNQVIWPYVRGLCTEAGRAKFRAYR